MFYVGKEFDANNGGYKTLPGAKKAADKIGGNVYDDNGVIVYPEQQAATTPEEATETATEPTEKEEAEENTTKEENAENEAQEGAEAELTDDVPDGALDTNPDGSVNTYNENGEQVGTISAEELEELQATAGESITDIHGTVTVVRDGLLAIRNAASWEDGHKCGICRTGYTVEVVQRLNIKGGVLYKTANGRYISGRKGDTVFNAAE